MRKKILLGIIIFLLGMQGLLAQNLIRNGSFETMNFSNCLYSKISEVDTVIPPWFGRVHDIWHLDCFWNANGGCTTPSKAGERYVSIFLSIGGGAGVQNSYVGIALSEPLVAEETYYFEMNFSDIGYISDLPAAYRESLGVHFSKEPLDIDKWTYRSEVPQISNTLPPPYGCGIWQEISNCFVAKGGEQYVTLGFFNHPVDPPAGVEAIGGFIHIDDIKLASVDELEKVLGPDLETCVGERLELTLRVESPIVTNYLWQDGSASPTLSVTEPGLYWVEMKNDCFTIRDTLVITQSDFSVNLGPDVLFCENSTEVTLQSPEGSTYFLWNDDVLQPSFKVTQAGIYWLNAGRNGCFDQDTITFYSDSMVNIDLGMDTNLCQVDLPWVLGVDVPETLYDVTWQDGSTGLSYPVTRPGNFQVAVTNSCGTQSSSIAITIDDCRCKLYMPNAFSPNNDGINDALQAFLECPYTQAREVALSIFDRWGNQLFSTADIHQGWDGTSRERDMNTGVYVWQLTWQEETNDGVFQREIQRGEVYLLR